MIGMTERRVVREDTEVSVVTRRQEGVVTVETVEIQVTLETTVTVTLRH